MYPRTGFDLESGIKKQLEGFGAVLGSKEEWDHRSKLDFVVFAMTGLARIPSVGVQVTQKAADLGKITEFLTANPPSARVCDQILYVELDPKLDDSSAGISVYSILRQLLLDQAWSGKDSFWARVNHDLTYSIEDLRSHVEVFVTAQQGRLLGSGGQPNTGTQPSADGERLPNGRIEGILTTYQPNRGMGYASTKDAKSYFVHVTQVVDPELKERLTRYGGDNAIRLSQPVLFRPSGFIRPGVRCEQALEVVIAR